MLEDSGAAHKRGAARRPPARRPIFRLEVVKFRDLCKGNSDNLEPSGRLRQQPRRQGAQLHAQACRLFTRFLHDGRICLSNNAAERALRGIALGRKSWLFAGSDRGGERAAVMLTLIQTAMLNDVDPQAWLADVLARIADHMINDLAALLPWNWHPTRIERAA